MAMHSKSFSVHLDGVGGVKTTDTGVYKNTRGRKALNDISNSKSVIPIGEEDLDGVVKTNTLEKKTGGGGRKKPLALKKTGEDEEKELIKKKTRGGKALNDDTSNAAIGEDDGVSKKMIKKRGRKAMGGLQALKKRMGTDEEKKKSTTISVVVEEDSAEEEKEEEEIRFHNHDECIKSLRWSYEDDPFKRLCQATGHDPNLPPHIPPTDDMNFRSPSPTKSSSSDKGPPFGIPPIPPSTFRDLKYPTAKLSELSDSEQDAAEEEAIAEQYAAEEEPIAEQDAAEEEEAITEQDAAEEEEKKMKIIAEQDSAEEEEKKMKIIAGHHNHEECQKSQRWSCEDDLFYRHLLAAGHDPRSPPHISPTDDMNFRSPSPTKSCDKGPPFGIPPIPPWMFRDLKYPTAKLSELSDSE